MHQTTLNITVRHQQLSPASIPITIIADLNQAILWAFPGLRRQ